MHFFARFAFFYETSTIEFTVACFSGFTFDSVLLHSNCLSSTNGVYSYTILEKLSVKEEVSHSEILLHMSEIVKCASLEAKENDNLLRSTDDLLLLPLLLIQFLFLDIYTEIYNISIR